MYELNNTMREALTVMQYYIDKNSEYTLLIFKDKDSIDRYKKKIMWERPDDTLASETFKDFIFITETELFYEPTKLNGRRFRHYMFIYED